MKKMKLLAAAFLLGAALGLTSAPFAAAADEAVNLTWWLYSPGGEPEDWPEVQDALNKYSKEKIGVTCEYKFYDAGQVALAMSSGEPFDLCFTCDWFNDFATNASDGMFLDLTLLLDEYVPDLVKSMPENVWGGSYYDGRIYAIPHLKDYALEVFWILDSDYFLKEKGFTEEHEISWDGIEPYLEAYKKDNPNDYPLIMSMTGATGWSNCLVDWISRDVWIGLDWDAQGTDNELKVRSALEIPKYTDRLKTLHRWYEAGYINPDAAVTETFNRLTGGPVQSGQGWFGAESIWSSQRQRLSYIARYDGPYLNTSSLRGAMTAISSTSDNWKEALALVQLMNTDPYYRETARYGIEGKHFTRNDDGTVTRTTEGVERMAPEAYSEGFYNIGALESSSFEAIPTDPDMWEKVFDSYKDAVESAAIGFSFDYSPVDYQFMAVSNIAEQYKYELYTGTSDPEKVIPEILEQMYDAGLQDIIDEAQRQLDEYMS